jgi:hypothetical protein
VLLSPSRHFLIVSVDPTLTRIGRRRIVEELASAGRASRCDAGQNRIMESEVRRAEERLRTGMLASDVTALDALVDDDLLFIAPTGALIRKADDLALHRSGAQRFTRLDLDDVLVALHGNAAVTVVIANLAGEAAGVHFEGRFRYTRTWVRREQGWKVVAGSVCPIAT